MWPLSWFAKKDDPDDYERILADLAISITSKQTRLSEIRLRERRASLVVTLYAIGGWLLYVALWWTVLPRIQLWRYQSRDDMTVQAIIKGVPAVIGPVLILFVRRLVQMWYTRKGDQEEKQLKSLMAEQRTKIEEIKKKTNYYTTKNLLDRYDDSPSRKPNGPNTPNGNLRQRQVPGNPKVIGTPGTPQSAPKPPALMLTPNGPSTGQRRLPQQYLQATPQQPIAPSRKQWYDKLADALLGEDEASSGTTHSRYALICDNCFAHNGLVRESEWDDMKYVCPKCGVFNPSPRMKREHPDEYASPQSRAPSQLPSAISFGRRNGSSSPPPFTPLTAGSMPNSPEPYRTRFERSKLAAVQEPSSSPTSDRPRGRSSGREEEVEEDADASMAEAETSHRASSPMKVD